MNKIRKTLLIVFFVCISILLIIIIVRREIRNYIKENMDITTDITKYDEFLGRSGKYTDNYFGIYNDIFPEKIKEDMSVEDFYYEYINIGDPGYLGYLVYTCSDNFFDKEYKRLKKLSSSNNYNIYGITGFPFELVTIYADDKYGLIYALADNDNNRFIYVQIQYCNYFSDIDYKKIIDSKYLPYGFDAHPGNSVRREFDEQSL